MKKILMLVCVVGFLLTTNANAQGDSSDQGKKKKDLASQQASSKQKVTPAPVSYNDENRTKIEIDRLPDGLRLTLETNEQYRGWHDATFYLDRTTNQYILTLTEENKTRTFIFDETGQLVVKRKDG
jgi:hypothetical protein